MSETLQGQIVPVDETEPVVYDPIKPDDAVSELTQSNLNITPADLAQADAAEDIGAFRNFSNAFQKSLIAGTKADLAELVGQHEFAVEVAREADERLKTEGGPSEFLGSTIGSIAPTAVALVAPVVTIPLLAYYGARAMGAGRGAVKSYEDISGEDVSSADEYMVMAGYGLAVFATERLGLRNLKGVINKMAPNAFKNVMKAYASGSAKKTSKSLIKEITKIQTKAGFAEAKQEGMEQALTNVIDTYYGAKGIGDIMQGVPEAVGMGFTGGAIIGGAGSIAQTKTLRKELKQISVQRTLAKNNPNMSDAEVSHVSAVVSSIGDGRGITSKEALQEVTDSTPAGVADLRNEVDLLKRTAQKSTVDAFVSNSMPIFKRVVDAGSFSKLESWLKKEEGTKWKNKDSKKFRKALDTYMVEGRAPNKKIEPALAQYQTWLAGVSAHTFETGYFAGAKSSVINFVDQVHGASEVESHSPFDREAATRRIAFNLEWQHQMEDMVDVRGAYKRIGAPNTGDAMVNMTSIQDMIQTKTLVAAGQMARSMKKNGFDTTPHSIDNQDAALIFENEAVFNKLPKEKQRALKPAKEIWDQYIKDAKLAYQEEGAIDEGFFEEMNTRLNEQKSEASSVGDLKLLNKIEKQLEKIKGAKFVPIPYHLWFEKLLVNNPRRLNRMLTILGTKKRKTIFISDLLKAKAIKKEDIDIFEILGYYGGRLARDIPLLKLKNTGTEEGLIKERKTGEKVDYRGGFVKPPRSAGVLKGTQIRGPLADGIHTTTQYHNNMKIVDKGLNITKMGQFIDPFFLPLYDTVQASMLGSISPIPVTIRKGKLVSPVAQTIKNMAHAARDMYEHNADWYEAGLHGTRSTPYANPIQNFNEFIENISKHPNPIVRNLVGILDGHAFKTAYNLSWKVAWTLDGYIRQVSYRFLRDDLGYSPKEAGRIAALYHGDYAGVPSTTRRQVNRFMFTPTFKIAMGKLFTKMIKDSMTVSLKGGKIAAYKLVGKEHDVKITKEEKLHTASLVRTVAIIGAMDMLMTSFLGFERDQFGRRYVKKNVETPQGQKDVVWTMSNPSNMWLKYPFRAMESFGDPGITEAFSEFAKKNSWELHPMWRMVNQLARNERTNGQPIYPHLADADTKLEMTMAFVLREASALVDEIVTSTSGQTDEAITRDVIQKEFGKVSDFVSRLFVYAYLRTSGDTKRERQVQQLKRVLSEDLNIIVDKDGNISPVMLKEILKNFKKRLDKIRE